MIKSHTGAYMKGFMSAAVRIVQMYLQTFFHASSCHGVAQQGG